MSIERALEFIAHTAGDSALQARLARLKGRSALADLCAIAAEAGYAFTEESYRAAVVTLAEGQLDDAAIREVQAELGMGEGP